MKTYLLSLTFLFVAFSVNAQKKGVASLLTSGKWYVYSTQEKGEEPEVSEDKNDEWIVYMPDGKAKEAHFGENTTATWKLSKGNDVITLDGSSKRVQKILEVSKEKLVVEMLEDLRKPEESLILVLTK